MTVEKIINEAWENKDQVNQNSDQSLKDAINQAVIVPLSFPMDKFFAMSSI